MTTIQAHLFRAFTSHNVPALTKTIDYPVTGVVIVPSTVRDINAYIADRLAPLAELRMVIIARRPPNNYGTILAAMALPPEIRNGLGMQPSMPPKGLVHVSPAIACEACRVLALCDRNLAGYLGLRARLEQVCDSVTKPGADFIEALEIRLNSAPLAP
jgi:hypothetical protein